MNFKKLFAVILGSLVVLALSLPVLAQSTTQSSSTTTTQNPPPAQTQSTTTTTSQDAATAPPAQTTQTTSSTTKSTERQVFGKPMVALDLGRALMHGAPQGVAH